MELSLKKGMDILIPAVAEELTKKVIAEIPEKGVFSTRSFGIKFPRTRHEGWMGVEYSREHGCAVRAGVLVNGSDQMISNYLFFGSREETLAWLADSDRQEETKAAFFHLLERADQKD